ncbi:MAG: hypothetical protein K2Q22_11865, partial [Cytophagales bacterium]|nr:hypothetical protein [Cytophagales bacterium]
RLEKGIIPVMLKNYQTTLFAYEQNQENLPMVLEAWEAYQEVKMQQLEVYQELISLSIQYEKEIQAE